MSVEDRVSAASDHTEINCFELKNVCAGYDTNNVLHDISIRLPAGRNVCILGENGCGKTTLLRTMTGLLPYSGQILLDRHDLRKMKRKEIASDVSMMSQFSDMFFSYTVYETVMLGRYLHSEKRFGGNSDGDRDAVMKCLETTNLLDIKDRRITELSGGQLQRVYLARTFAQDAPVILLDEPTNHLDLKHQQELVSYLQKWSKEDGHTVIGVFHDINLAMQIADNLIFMKDGRIVSYGKADEVLTSESLRKVYDFDVAGYMRESLANWQKI
ncbi:MAG: ABC transporter ATP-binding protein [Lachnospiraceae bacterium]|nr:ABC transporter ATP-binding protein [Lachnospiraceae bacterium]